MIDFDVLAKKHKLKGFTAFRIDSGEWICNMQRADGEWLNGSRCNTAEEAFESTLSKFKAPRKVDREDDLL